MQEEIDRGPRVLKAEQIRQAQEKKVALEDAILATMAELEEKVAAIPAVDKQWADAQAEFAQFQVDAAERLERLRADQVHAQAELAKFEAEIPEKVRPV